MGDSASLSIQRRALNDGKRFAKLTLVAQTFLNALGIRYIYQCVSPETKKTNCLSSHTPRHILKGEEIGCPLAQGREEGVRSYGLAMSSVVLNDTPLTEREGEDVRAIANYVLEYAARHEMKLTLMQLLKLLYIAHGWSTVLTDSVLISNQPQAWQYGPVYPHVYKSFSQCGSGAIPDNVRATDKITGGIFWPSNLSMQHRALIEDVVDWYGKKHAFDLSNMTYKPNTPWAITYEKSGPYKEISLPLMREHYSELKQARNIDDSRWKNVGPSR